MAALRWGTLLVVALAVWSPSTAFAQPCGAVQGLGIATTTRLLAEDGGQVLEMTAELFAAPLAPQRFRPLVLVDGRLANDQGQQLLPCGAELTWRTPPLTVQQGVHWFLVRWPEVPEALSALDFGQAVATFGAQPPATRPWGDAELRRPVGASPSPRRVGDGFRWREATPDDQEDDLIVILDAAGEPQPDRLVRLRVGEAANLRVRYLGFGDDGTDEAMLLVCFAGGRQLDAFDGRPALPVAARPGWVMEADGQVVVDRPGWHRLHCMLLEDAEGEAPAGAPRPLRNLYLWAEP